MPRLTRPLIAALGAVFLLISGFRPGALPYTPGQPFSDAVTSHLPAAEYLRRSLLEDGSFPLWRETILAGQPFAGDPLNKTAYPLQWLVLLLPPVLHLDVLILLHLLIAGTGMWMWARALGLREEAAGLSALAYALAPRLVGHTGAGHLDLLYALAWFPWLMWAVGNVAGADFKSALMKGTSSDVGARRVLALRAGKHIDLSLQSILYVALFAGLLLLADVRVSLFAYTLAAAYAVYEAAHGARLRSLWRFVPAGALALLLTLSVTIPLLAWRPYLSRADLTMQEAGVFSLAPGYLLGLLLPPQGGNIETLTYLGLPVLALALIGAATAQRRGLWIAACALALLYALGANGFLWPLLVRVVPALLWLRVPSRAWFVVTLLAPLLAGYGLHWLIEHGFRRGRPLALAGTAIALLVGAFMLLRVPVINGWALLVGGGGFGPVCLLGFGGRLRGERLALALIVVTFLDLAISGRGWLEWRTQEAWLPPDQVALAQRLTELGAYRVYSPSYSLQQQVAEEYHLRLFGGVDPFQLSGIADAIEQGGGITTTGYSVVLPPLDSADPSAANRSAVPNTAILGEWGVTHVVSAYPLNAATLEQVDLVGGVYLYANRDPALVTNFSETPAWPEGRANLPDRAQVAIFNTWTVDAAVVSGAALISLLACLVVMKVRH